MSRRQLLQQPYLPPTSRVITDDSGNVIGRYGILQGSNGHKYAFWKLNSFSLSPGAYLGPWNQFILMASSLGVDKLVYDVSGNGEKLSFNINPCSVPSTIIHPYPHKLRPHIIPAPQFDLLPFPG